MLKWRWGMEDAVCAFLGRRGDSGQGAVFELGLKG